MHRRYGTLNALVGHMAGIAVEVKLKQAVSGLGTKLTRVIQKLGSGIGTFHPHYLTLTQQPFARLMCNIDSRPGSSEKPLSTAA